VTTGAVCGIEKFVPPESGTAVAVGFFDGVHWGHRSIFENLVASARGLGVSSLALTFDKHPAELLAPDRAPNYINTIEQRIELIKALSVDHVVVAEFNHELANLDKAVFARRVLLEAFRTGHIVVGSNFRFGAGREGDTRYLKVFCKENGVSLSVVPAVIVNGGPVSSTRIRELIARGDVEDAAKLLGRRFALRGVVVAGERLGRTIGFPTANILPGPRQVIPAGGVYVVESVVGHTSYAGVCNIGTRPTFSGTQRTIEVHFSGFEGDIYGLTLDIIFCRRLRDEMAFESPERLAEQIRHDLERAGRAAAPNPSGQACGDLGPQ